MTTEKQKQNNQERIQALSKGYERVKAYHEDLNKLANLLIKIKSDHKNVIGKTYLKDITSLYENTECAIDACKDFLSESSFHMNVLNKDFKVIMEEVQE